MKTKLTTLLLSTSLIPFGCGPDNAIATGDSAPQATLPASQLAPASQAPAPAPVRTEPNPERATPTPRVRLVVPDGTLLPIELQSTLSSDASREGDSVLAVLTEDVPLQGFTLDKGSEVRGRIFTAVPAKRVKGRARLVFGFEAVMEKGERVEISTEAIDTLGKSTAVSYTHLTLPTNREV